MEENQLIEQEDPVPADLRAIQKTLRQLDDYKKVIESGTFSGRISKEVSELKDFIEDLYKQAYDKFTTHPYYIQQVGPSNEESN
jgi:membrane-associated protease RseP (regulator of RpoE activity)